MTAVRRLLSPPGSSEAYQCGGEAKRVGPAEGARGKAPGAAAWRDRGLGRARVHEQQLLGLSWTEGRIRSYGCSGRHARRKTTREYREPLVQAHVLLLDAVAFVFNIRVHFGSCRWTIV